MGCFVPPQLQTIIRGNTHIKQQYNKHVIALARRRNDDDYDDEDDDWDAYFDDKDEEEDDDEYYNRRRRRGGRRRPSAAVDDLGTPPLTGSSPDDTSLSIPSSFGRGDTGWRMPTSVSAGKL